MKYKGKQVSRHRYNQLKKTNENWKKFLEEHSPKAFLTKESYERLVELLKEGE